MGRCSMTLSNLCITPAGDLCLKLNEREQRAMRHLFNYQSNYLILNAVKEMAGKLYLIYTPDKAEIE
jgi:hypothetical protein